MRRSILLSLTLLAASSCADLTTSPPVPDEPTTVASTETRQQAVLDADGPNWMVVGGAGLVEMVGGSDGEPNELTGRFALDGAEIVNASGGTDKWIVAGNGKTQALDGTGTRVRESRDALDGETVTFIERGPVGWMIGGANGRVQLLDAEGEPTQSMIQVLDNTTINHAAFNGTTWLVVGENGNLVPINQSLGMPPTPSGQSVGAALTAVVAEPSQTDIDPPWLAFTDDSYIAVSGTGVPGATGQIENGLQITTAEFFAGNVYIGTSDGRVGVASYGATPNFSFTDLFGGAPVTKLVSNGTEFIALSDDGRAHRVDGQGAAVGGPVQISSDASRPLVGAYWNGTNWLIVVGSIGFVAFVDDTLAPPRQLDSLLDGETVLDAAMGDNESLLVGTAGAYQVVDSAGNSSTTPASLGTADLHAASWSGEQWLVVGDDGFAQLIDSSGSPAGSSPTLLGGNTIRFAAWSGEFWLIGGDGGNFQLVRTDGTASGDVRQLSGATELRAARWSGTDWLMAGVSDNGNGVISILQPDPNFVPTATEIPEIGPLNAVDFNGIEWLVAGDNGMIHRASAQGMPFGEPSDVLTGFDIHDIYFNGNEYLVAGEFGALRRLGQDYLPIRAPIAVIDRFDVASVEWTTARGHASGPCLSNDSCYRGPCVGGLAQGACCDRACDKPCESCFQDDTGETDGTCAPVVADKRPVSDGCQRQSESTCGFTGMCDGRGECQFYGLDVQCGDAICSLGMFTPDASCTGTGACESVEEVDCAPYTGCSETGCFDSCIADDDCVSGFVCSDDGACIEEDDSMMMEEEDPTDDEPADDGGCCATANGGGPSTPWLFGFLALLFAAVRRR